MLKTLNRWKNYFCQLLNLQGAGGVRQTEIYTAEPFVPQPSASEDEVAIVVIPIHQKGDKTECSNYRGILSLSTSCKILSNILLSRLINMQMQVDFKVIGH
jgi:hypothetical protein